MKGFFDLVPRELEESAILDGATPFVLLTRVVLPLAVPGMIAVGLLAFFSSYTEYLYSLILTRVQTVTLPVLMAGYLSEFKVEWRKISAISMLSAIPMLAFYSYLLTYMRRGLLYGIMKG
jgi:multiple sugar transport system permease protein